MWDVASERGPLCIPHALLHPLWALSLLVLVVNDGYLKGGGFLSPVVTGKLSDFAGMLVAPVLLASLAGAQSRQGMVVCHVAVGGGFAVLKLVEPFAAAVGRLGSHLGIGLRVVCDCTDLVALPVLAVSYAVFSGAAEHPDRMVRSWQRVGTVVAGLVGVLACAGSLLPTATRPVLTNDAVYVPGPGGQHVLQPRTGMRVKVIPAHLSDPVVLGDRIYGRSLEAWNVKTATRVFGSPLGEYDGEQLLVAKDRLIVVARLWPASNIQPFVAGIDFQTGAVVWRVSGIRPRVASDGEVVIAITTDDRLLGIDVETGRIRWSIPLPGISRTGLVFGYGGNLAVAVDHSLSRVSRDGALVGGWVNTGRFQHCCRERRATWPYCPEHPDGLLVLVDKRAMLFHPGLLGLRPLPGFDEITTDMALQVDQPTIIARRLKDGAELWAAPPPLEGTVEYAANTDVVVAASHLGHVAGMDARTGRLLWKWSIEAASARAGAP